MAMKRTPKVHLSEKDAKTVKHMLSRYRDLYVRHKLENETFTNQTARNSWIAEEHYATSVMHKLQDQLDVIDFKRRANLEMES